MTRRPTTRRPGSEPRSSPWTPDLGLVVGAAFVSGLLGAFAGASRSAPRAVAARAEFEGAELDLEVARETFEQARAIAQADGGELWGVSLDFPLLFVDPVTRAAVANRADEKGHLSPRDGVWVGRYPADRGVANFATEWAGVRWTMVVWPLPADLLSRARLVMHESFHNAQFELDVSGSSAPCEHMATSDGRIWTRLEARALVAALRADPEDGSREEAVGDALLFRAMRRSLFPGSAEAEDGLERVEGSAEYTGVRLCSPEEAVRTEVTIGLLEGLARRRSLTRSFQYATGPALGLLLDGYDPYWREDFLSGAELSSLLTPAVAFEIPVDLEAAALECSRRYGFEEIELEELELERRREELYARFRARLLEGPVLILPAASARTSFDPSGVHVIEGLGTVYDPMWASDAWGVADTSGGALQRPNGDLHLAAPSDLEGPELAGDGWTLELAEGWRIVPGEREGDYRAVLE